MHPGIITDPSTDLEVLTKDSNAYFFFEAAKLRVSGPYLTLVDDAHKPGKICPQFKIVSGASDADGWAVYRKCLRSVTAADVRAFLLDHYSGWDGRDKFGFTELKLDGSTTLFISNQVSSQIFSPFALSVFKPLRAIPAKWTLTQVKQILANNQFENLVCAGKYTDNYSLDEEENYGRGPAAALDLLERLIERSGNGWRVSFDASLNEVEVAFYHSESYKFFLKL